MFQIGATFYLTALFVVAAGWQNDSDADPFQINAKFTQQSLEQFLESKPELWKSTPLPDAQLDRYRSLVGGAASAPQEDLRLATFSRLSRKFGRRRFSQNGNRLPREFDARRRWPECPSIEKIQDQSRCADCWAVAAASAMSDRICIASRGRKQVQISATDLLSCCENCSVNGGDGCQTGYAFRAWQHWVNRGVVSGGSYLDRNGCKPYIFPPCQGSSHSGCPAANYQAPSCSRTCQGNRQLQYGADKYFGQRVIYPKGVEEMQRELYENGPIEVRMEMYTDFLSYTGGIYYHRSGQNLGGHSVKLIGWGEEGSVPYWIFANSWNTGWGEAGFFKIVRGVNHVKIEEEAVCGLPNLMSSPRRN